VERPELRRGKPREEAARRREPELRPSSSIGKQCRVGSNWSREVRLSSSSLLIGFPKMFFRLVVGLGGQARCAINTSTSPLYFLIFRIHLDLRWSRCDPFLL
jgi:hypothetical protein